ncbi:PhoH family protein (plasmid) [Vibrio scophthalmi]|uniref:PhoH family protein n=1 Tax=Vibrio scophthalmi TaxID=45658 RepID=UPI003EBA1F1E
MTTPNRKLYFFDTNVLIADTQSLISMEDNDITISMKVLAELDGLKDSSRVVSVDARQAIKQISGLLDDRTFSEISKGVRIDSHLGRFSIIPDYKAQGQDGYLEDSDADAIIINTVLKLQSDIPDRYVVLLSRDINMRLRAKAAGVEHVEDYRSDKISSDEVLSDKGYKRFSGSFYELVEQTTLRAEKDLYTVTLKNFERDAVDLSVGKYIIDDDELFGRVTSINSDNGSIEYKCFNKGAYLNKGVWGIKPKNDYQAMALEALMSEEIDLVTITGAAGSGKTLLALAAAMECTIESKRFEKIIITRNTPNVAEDIGSLPGSETEKMIGYFQGITDNLEVLHGDDVPPPDMLNKGFSSEYIMEKANIQFKSINYLRGASCPNTLILLDESQNLTASMIKTVITRTGKGSKIVCLGNLNANQIDAKY